MNVETREKDRGTEIRVETEEKVAVAVKDSEGERIYLPEGDSSDSSYYVEEPGQLQETSYGYRVLHSGKIEDVEVIRGDGT